MSKKLYVGNLKFTTNTADLRAMFGEHGEVAEAIVIEDRETGRSRGFGFVEMSTAEEAQKAISAMDGKNIDGRQLKVNLARERSR